MTVDQNSKVSAVATRTGVGKTTAAEPNRVVPKPLPPHSFATVTVG